MWSFPDFVGRRPRRLAAVLLVLGVYPACAATVGFRTRELPWAPFGSSYRVTLEAFVDGRCVDGGVVFSVTAGDLPRGLELRGDTIAGVPEEFGAFGFRLRAANDCGAE